MLRIRITYDINRQSYKVHDADTFEYIGLTYTDTEGKIALHTKENHAIANTDMYLAVLDILKSQENLCGVWEIKIVAEIKRIGDI